MIVAFILIKTNDVDVDVFIFIFISIYFDWLILNLVIDLYGILYKFMIKF